MLHRMTSLPLIAAALLAASLATSSCGESERTYVMNLSDPETMPTMRTIDVHTLISDSGYTRYRITAPLWLMFEEAKDPRWNFPEGLNVQQYDEQFRPSARIYCDSAVYFSARKLWRLDGDVVMVNTLRDTFLTQQLFWDQNLQKVYSDSFIHIVRQDRTIEGYGFSSNESMTRFDVKKTQAIIPVRDLKRNDDTPVADSTANTAVDMDDLDARRRRGAPQRASKRNDNLKKLEF